MLQDLVVKFRDRIGAATTVLTGDKRQWSLAAIALGWLLTLGVRFLVPAILPQIKATFGLDNSEAGLAITVIWVGYALMQFPAGVLVNRLGERTLLCLSLVLAGGSIGALSVAPTVSVFLLACGIFGLGTGLYGPTRGTAVSKMFSQTPGTAFGVMLAAGSLGSAVLPFLANLTVEKVGWRLTVGVLFIPFIAVAVLAWNAIPDLRTADDMTDDSSPLATARDILGAILDRTVVVAVLGTILMLFTFQGLSAFLPTYLIVVKGLDQSVAAGLFSLMFISGAGFQLLGGSASDRYGERQVLVATAGIGVLSVGLLPFVDGILPLTVLVIVLGSRLAVAPVANSYIIAILPDHVTGTAWGLLRTGFFLIAAMGSLFVGILADADLFDEAFLVLAGFTGLATLSYFALPVYENHT